jgi:hypothetical protein
VTDRFARHAFGTIVAVAVAICLQQVAGLMMWLALFSLGAVTGPASFIAFFLPALIPGLLAFGAAAFALARWMGVREAANWILALGIAGVLVNLALGGVVATGVGEAPDVLPYLRAALAIAPMLGAVAGRWFAGKRP